MANSNIPWAKILPIFGAGLAVFFAFVNGGSAGTLIAEGYGFNGVCSAISALAWLAVAVLIYKNYQKQDLAQKKKE